MSAVYQNVHIRVNDVATGKPTPVRIRFVGPDGQYYAPFGRLPEFGTGPAEDVGGNVRLEGKNYAYIDGTCEIRLPVGEIAVEIHKGLEYWPVSLKVPLPPGKLALRFEIQRWSDLRKQGWYAGDTHCYFLSPQAALLEGAAEDLAVVNVLACPALLPGAGGTTYPAITNILAFSGQQPALAMPGHLVAVNTVNKHGWLGAVALLHCHRVVYPLTFGSPEMVDEWNLADVCGQCHRKGGLVVGLDYLDGPQEPVGEILADLILGHVDVLKVPETDPAIGEDFLSAWQELQRIGLRIPVVAGSGKASNQQALGSYRTYALLWPGEELTCKNWIAAVRAGRTFVTRGPLLQFAAPGPGPGVVIQQSEAQERAYLPAQACSLTPFQTLEIVNNGTVVDRVPAQYLAGLWVARIDGVGPAPKPGWVCARCTGPAHDGLHSEIVAHTSPIYVECAGHPEPPDAAALQVLMARLDRIEDQVRQQGRFETDAQRERMLSVYWEAQAELRRRLSRAAAQKP